MPDIVLYTTELCPFCKRAKELLNQRGLGFREIDVAKNAGLRQEMIKVTGRRSVPQLVIDGNPIGGYQELLALAEEGKL